MSNFPRKYPGLHDPPGYRSDKTKLLWELRKAIRQHKKRSHIRRALTQLSNKWMSYNGGLMSVSAVIFKAQYGKLAAAVSDTNPILEMLRKRA